MLRDLEFMLELQEPSERFLRKMLLGFFYYKSNKDTFFFCLHCMACGI